MVRCGLGKGSRTKQLWTEHVFQSLCPGSSRRLHAFQKDRCTYVRNIVSRTRLCRQSTKRSLLRCDCSVSFRLRHRGRWLRLHLRWTNNSFSRFHWCWLEFFKRLVLFRFSFFCCTRGDADMRSRIMWDMNNSPEWASRAAWYPQSWWIRMLQERHICAEESRTEVQWMHNSSF